MDNAIINACNALTRRWSESLTGSGTCLSGPGLWLLLAALQSTAAGDAERELAQATGVETGEAAAAAAAMMNGLRTDPSVQVAAGVWVGAQVELRADLGTALPGVDVGRLTDSAALDAWVAERTHGLITSLGLAVSPATAMLLASALAADAEWQQSFESGAGTWRDGQDCSWLTRDFDDFAAGAIIGGRYSRVTVASRGRFDVQLVAGPAEDSPAAVLSAAVAALATPDDVRRTTGVADAGVGAFVAETRPADSEAAHLAVELPPFDIVAHHDLTQSAESFGLAAACRPRPGHFPGLADQDLYVSQAVQDARATFTRSSFRAAAVTALEMRMTSARIMQEAETLVARHDRPFGYLVVDRESGLVLFAGWVDAPGR